jgi:transcription elongation factor Elf1
VSAAGPSGERAVPFYCPFCGDEDLVPDGASAGHWACRSCIRRFELHLTGIGRPDDTD